MQSFKLLPLAIVIITSCLTTVNARPLEEIEKTKLLKVGVPGDYAPLAFKDKDSNQLVGFDIDLIRDFAKQHQWTIEFVETSWPTVSSDLKADQFDVAIGGITYTDKRAAEFNLSDPILPNGKIALARCSISAEINEFDKINTPKVKLVVNPGGTNESFVNEYMDKAEVIRVKDNFENLQALRDQTADVMVTDLIEGNYYQYKEPNVLCMATTTPFKNTESYKAYMTNKDDGKLVDSINQWLKALDKNEIAKKWGVQP